MSLSANMWTSVSGLLTHGEKMNVIGNNLANVSTIGFKAQRADFSDFLYTNYGTASGTDQMGKGTAINAIIGDFSQGSFENTNSATDLAINGNGFFKVHDTGRNADYYTRAGDFYFDKDRTLVNPNGLVVQGWRTSQETNVTFGDGALSTSNEDVEMRRTGVPVDIVLDQWNITPKRTTNITIANNLVNDDKYDTTTSETNPLTALFDKWDASQVKNGMQPLSDDAYATQSSIQAYDDSGNTHTLTVYMDKVNAELTTTDSTGNPTTAYTIDGLPPGYSIYEYLVTMDPTEDKRMYGGTYDANTGKYTTNGTKFYDEGGTVNKKAGVLMSGVMVFNTAGQLVSQSAYTYGAQTEPTNEADQVNLDPSDAGSWQPTKFSNNGLPVFTANFSGKALANSVSEADAEANLIELDLGLNSPIDQWSVSDSSNPTSLADLVVDANKVLDYDKIAKVVNGVRDADATANNGYTFMTDIQDDGYTSGVLSNYTIDQDGVVYGYYSNGENIPLYQIAMYDFHNLQGLYREGGNLYSATHESGDPVEGVAGTGTFGSIQSYYTENSNVDMSREFVQMISCQRGFQANSKSITTTDTMLETVIGMKR